MLLICNWRYATVVRERGASRPCIPSRGSEILSLRGWTFLLRVEHVGSLLTSWMLLVCRIGGVWPSREGGERRAPASPQGWQGSFAARLGVSIEGSAQRSDGAFGTSRALLVCGIGGARPLLEGGERRSPASPQGVARFFCCAVGRFLEGRAQCSDGAFGTSGVPLVCRIGGAQPSREGGERRAPASPQEAARFFRCAVGRFY